MSLNEPFWPPESSWKPPKEFPRLDGIKLIGLDCETKIPTYYQWDQGQSEKMAML